MDEKPFSAKGNAVLSINNEMPVHANTNFYPIFFQNSGSAQDAIIFLRLQLVSSAYYSFAS